jgi:hypothetical protein
MGADWQRFELFQTHLVRVQRGDSRRHHVLECLERASCRIRLSIPSRLNVCSWNCTRCWCGTSGIVACSRAWLLSRPNRR